MTKYFGLLSILFSQVVFASPILHIRGENIFYKTTFNLFKIFAGLIPVKLTYWGKEIEIDKDRNEISPDVGRVWLQLNTPNFFSIRWGRSRSMSFFNMAKFKVNEVQNEIKNS